MKHEHNEVPKCPHCNFLIFDYWESVGFADGDESKLDCHSCGKTFHVETHVSRSFTTSKPECDDGVQP